MYDYKYLIDYEYEGNIFEDPLWPKTNSAISNLKTSKEEKKMHKKDKVNGHVVHRLPKCPGLYYTVDPENSRIAVYMLKYDEATGEPCYAEFEDITICTKRLGRHGYLEEQINSIARRHSDYTIRETLSRIADEYEKLMNGDFTLKALNDTIFEEEKKMIEYYVIDVDMTFDDRAATRARTALQIRQHGNYFEIPFDAPDCKESQLESLEKCLRDYIMETKKPFSVSRDKSEICSNSVLKIITPYADISDDENRKELCKMLTYAVEHKNYPYPPTDRNLGRLREVAFYLRECDKYEIYSKWYPAGIEGFIEIKGHMLRYFLPFDDYIMDPTDVVSLTFNNGWLTHYKLANGEFHRLTLTHFPIALYDIARHKKPFQSLTEVETLLREIHAKREMWKNASYLTFEHTTDRKKI